MNSMFFVKRTDCVLYEVGIECLNVCCVEFEVQEFNALWTEDDDDCSGEDDDDDDSGGGVGLGSNRISW